MLDPTGLRTEGNGWLQTLKQQSQRKDLWLQNNGRGERIRTFDPLVPNQMRYQAALRPDIQYSNRMRTASIPSMKFI